MKYFVGTVLDGKMHYLHYPNGNKNEADLTCHRENSVEFDSESNAKRAIKRLQGRFQCLKPYLNIIPEDIPDDNSPNEDLYHFCEINKLKNDLTKELSKCDLEISDLEHYMEFRELDIQRGYKAYKMMHEVRLKRRKIKDELTILTQIKSTILSTEAGLEARQYRPRIRTDIQYVKE